MTEPALAVSVSGYGRMYRHPVNEALYPSVTNIIDTLAKPWLAGWKAKMVAGFAFDKRRALMELGDDRDAAIDMLKGGPARIRDAAAGLGDTIHRYAEAVARNEPVPPIEEEHEPFVDAFTEFLDEFRPRFRVLEGIIFHGTPEAADRYAGTFDFLCDIPVITEENARWVSLLGDYKTGGDRVYAEVALQLAALRNGEELWDAETGDLLELPPIDGCIAVHIRPGQLKVHLIDAGERAYQAFMGLRMAWPWDKDNTGAVGPAMNLRRLIRELDKPITLFEQLEASVAAVAQPANDVDPAPARTVAAEPASGTVAGVAGGSDALDPVPDDDSPAASTQRSTTPPPGGAGLTNETEGDGVNRLLVAAPSPAGDTHER